MQTGLIRTTPDDRVPTRSGSSAPCDRGLDETARLFVESGPGAHRGTVAAAPRAVRPSVRAACARKLSLSLPAGLAGARSRVGIGGNSTGLAR